MASFRQRFPLAWQPFEVWRQVVDRTRFSSEKESAFALSLWEKAASSRELLERLEVGVADSVQTRNISDPGALGRVDDFLQTPDAKASLDSHEVEFKMVEIDLLSVIPEVIYLDFVDEICGKVKPGGFGERELAELCFPLEDNHPPVRTSKNSDLSYLFLSNADDLKLLKIVARDALSDEGARKLSPGRPAKIISLVVGYPSSFASAVQVGKRLFLSNGFHRLFALRKLGVKFAPVAVVKHSGGADSFASSEQIGLAGLGRPPLFKDYFDSRLYTDVKKPVSLRGLQIDLVVKSFEGVLRQENRFGSMLTDYDSLMTAIIVGQAEFMGEKNARQVARSLPGIVLDPYGKVFGGTKAALALLVEKYSEIQGASAAQSMANNSIRRLLKGGEDLPEGFNGA